MSEHIENPVELTIVCNFFTSIAVILLTYFLLGGRGMNINQLPHVQTLIEVVFISGGKQHRNCEFYFRTQVNKLDAFG